MSIQDKIISMEEFNAMKEIFDSKIKKKIGDAYSDFAIIPIKDLKAYIEMIEKQAAANETEVTNVLFHFASENTEIGQLTLVMEGTFVDKNLKAPMVDKVYMCPPICDL